MTPQFLVRFSAITTFVIAASVFADSATTEAAFKDRNTHFAEKDWGYIFYITTRPYAGEVAKDLERAIKLAVASDSVQPVLERCLPTKIGAGLYRIDLRDLGWHYDDWAEVAIKRNPYSLGQLPAIVRADWLLVEISDMQESDSYQRLLFGGKNLPKTKDDLFKFFKVIQDPALTFGIIEGQSEVSKQGTRRVESLPSPRGWAWNTFDVLKLDNDRDPVEHPDGKSPFDGQEIIIGIPKLSSTTGRRGALQWYALANGKNVLVNRAPVDLVEDHTTFRGFREIRTPGSCIQCHAEGLNAFKRNEFRELIKSGVDVFAGNRQKQELEAFHLSDLKTELSRANDDFQSIIELACGCKSADAVKSFKASVNRYDAPLGLLETAEELEVPVAEWTKILAASGAELPARFASLPHGGRIPRAAWEEGYASAYYASHGGQPLKRGKVEVKQENKPQEKKG